MTTAQPEDPDHDPPARGHPPTAITHGAMSAAFDEGAANLLSGAVNWVVRYCDAWWVVYEHGWLRITDSATAADLDQAARRLAQAEEAAKHAG